MKTEVLSQKIKEALSLAPSGAHKRVAKKLSVSTVTLNNRSKPGFKSKEALIETLQAIEDVSVEMFKEAKFNLDKICKVCVVDEFLDDDSDSSDDGSLDIVLHDSH